MFTIQFLLCSEPNASRVKTHSINAESKNDHRRTETHEGARCVQNVEFLTFKLVLLSISIYNAKNREGELF